MRTLTLCCRLVAGCAVLLGATVLQAQTIYRIVGADGRVTFSDRPPAEAANATAQSAAGRPVGAAAGDPRLPYELRQVVIRYPVTLYSGAGCVPCNAGRLMLQSRGVPFTEYTVTSNEDVEALQRISGDKSLPFLTIGGQKIKGYSEAEWTQFLNAANYPAASQLPSSYRNAQPKALVTVQQATAPEPAPAREPAESSAAASPVAPAPQPAVANPAGIKF